MPPADQETGPLCTWESTVKPKQWKCVWDKDWRNCLISIFWDHSKWRRQMQSRLNHTQYSVKVKETKEFLTTKMHSICVYIFKLIVYQKKKETRVLWNCPGTGIQMHFSLLRTNKISIFMDVITCRKISCVCEYSWAGSDPRCVWDTSEFIFKSMIQWTLSDPLYKNSYSHG